MRTLPMVCALLLVATASQAQQRRSGGAPPEPRETIAPVTRYPYAGTWHGQMRLQDDAVPISVDISILNDKYTSVSYGPGGGRMNHLSTELGDGLLRWQIKNSGAGVWVYEAKRIVADTIYGTVVLKDGTEKAGGTIFLVRQRP